MGTCVGVRGWIELTHEQREAVEQVLAAHLHDPYSTGWAVPARLADADGIGRSGSSC